MAKTIFDISMALDAQTPEWPGDVKFNYQLSVTKAQSGSVNIGEMSTSIIWARILMRLSITIARD